MTETTTEPEFVAETLAWCNEMRVSKGLGELDRLPKGELGNPRSCPCGKASGVSVGSTTAWNETRTICSLPKGVREFVQQFDNGLLPQYDEDIVDEAAAELAESYFDADGNEGTIDEVHKA